jgi:hypothetical protein
MWMLFTVIFKLGIALWASEVPFDWPFFERGFQFVSPFDAANNEWPVTLADASILSEDCIHSIQSFL